MPLAPLPWFNHDQTNVFALHDEALWILVEKPDGNVSLLVSLDAGVTWALTPSILPATPFERFSHPSVIRRGKTPDKASLIVPIFTDEATRLYISHDSGTSWKRGAVLDKRTTVPTSFGQYVFSIVHLGSKRRPEPASIALPNLYENL